MASRRVLAVTGALLITVTLGAACSRGGTPAAEQTAAESTQTSVADATPATTTTTQVPDDEQQVRDAVMAFQDAYNTQNWDACAPATGV